jgi:hypothetical protein
MMIIERNRRAAETVRSRAAAQRQHGGGNPMSSWDPVGLPSTTLARSSFGGYADRRATFDPDGVNVSRTVDAIRKTRRMGDNAE